MMMATPMSLPTCSWTLDAVDERGIRRLAEILALKIRVGDAVTLSGDLGAGKTTFARAMIRAVLGEPAAEVPSPTFSLVQLYDSDRITIAHADLYRVSGAGEAAELGLEEALGRGAVLVEWPERAPGLFRAGSIELTFSETDAPDARRVEMIARGDAAGRLSRAAAIWHFLTELPEWRDAHLAYLQGDASVRAYARVSGGPVPALLMDWPEQPDGPPVRDGKPYSRIAHLAEGTIAFDAVAGLLLEAGARAPAILARDHKHGLLLIEDLGDRVFGSEILDGASLEPLWRAATLELVRLRRLDGQRIAEWNARPDCPWTIRPYDAGALAIEAELFVDWYWPLVMGTEAPASVRSRFVAAWAPVFARILSGSQGLVLRDYHSPNLIWLPHESGRVGLIDFQDALLGHPAYDLVSLLQDARLDVPGDIEARLLEVYLSAAGSSESQFDRSEFLAAYAALGAQRCTKILGIFARLWKRDGKPQYLRHVPRLWRYLERDLAHPGLKDVKSWYDAHVPVELRRQEPRAA